MKKNEKKNDEFNNSYSRNRIYLLISSNSNNRRINKFVFTLTNYNQITTIKINVFNNIVSQITRYFNNLIKTKKQIFDKFNV